VVISDDNNSCNASLSTTDNLNYTGSCELFSETAGETISAVYNSDGLDTNYSSPVNSDQDLTVDIATPDLTLSGTPVTGDNTYSVDLLVPTDGAAPTEDVVISDNNNSCDASLSTTDSLNYTGSCTINSETAGETVSAVYNSDALDTNYSSPVNSDQDLTVDVATPDLTLSGSPVTGDNSYSVDLLVPTDGTVPTEGVVISDNNNSCDASLSSTNGTDYTGSCTLDAETAGETISAVYNTDGLDTNYATDVGSDQDLTVDVATPDLTLSGSPVTGDNTYSVDLLVPTDGTAPTEDVVISDNNNSCDAILSTSDNLNYTGSCTLDAETAGETISAVYNSDGLDTNYAAGVGSDQDLTVDVATPDLTLSGSPVTGDNTYSVDLLVPTDGAAPTEDVVISDNNNSCDAILSTSDNLNYTGSCTIDSETAGETISAVYNSDGLDTNYATDVGSDQDLSVDAATPTLTLLGTPVTGDNTYSVDLAVPVDGAAPTEDVVISDSNSGSCDAILSTSDNLNYTGSCTIDSETAGETVSAVYNSDDGDGNYTSPVDSVQVITVDAATPTISLAGSSPVTGDNTYTATVTVPTDGPAPTGTVTITDSHAAFCTTSSYSGSGPDYTASCTIVGEIEGATVTASVASDTNYAAAGPSGETVTVGAATPTIDLAGTSPVTGDNLYTATVTVPIDGAAPTGLVTITDSHAAFCTTSTYSGAGPIYTASCTIHSETPGTPVTASVAADSNYVAAGPSSQSVTVEAAPPTLTLSGSPLISGNNLYTATVTIPSADGIAPTGTVTVTDDATPTPLTCTTGALSGSGTTYTATCTINAESAGETVSANYGGDGNYTSANSNTLTVGSPPPAGPTAPPAPQGAVTSQSGTSDSSTGTATATNDSTTASGTGVGALTVSQYSANPVSTTPFATSTNEYFDVQVNTGNTFSTLAITDCNLNGGNEIFWYNATTQLWSEVTPETFSAGPPACVTANLSTTSSPAISQLTGTVFAAVTAAATAPGAPTDLTATAGNASATLSWIAPSSNGGSAILGYNVFDGTSPGGESGTPLNSALITGTTFTSSGGFTNGTTYYFTVKAVNAVGASAASAEASATPSASTTPPATSGYWEVASDGGIFSFGDAVFHGSTGSLKLNSPIVGMAATPDQGGYWLVAADGGIFSFGDAVFHGSTGSLKLNSPIVGMAVTPDGGGYWLVASDGGIFSFGDAVFHGSTGSLRLNSPVVGMAVTPDGGGYWLVASDGGIFSFGDAVFHGSTGSLRLNSPIVGMAATNDGGGYWLVASDGGIFSFGDAVFHGSEGGTHLNKPIVGMAGTPDGGGYQMVASDGGIFSFGDAAFHGSEGETTLNKPIVGMATS
jgi:aspartate 1-decarboxylase